MMNFISKNKRPFGAEIKSAVFFLFSIPIRSLIFKQLNSTLGPALLIKLRTKYSRLEKSKLQGELVIRTFIKFTTLWKNYFRDEFLVDLHFWR